MSSESKNIPIQRFEESTSQIRKLMEFDRTVVDTVIESLVKLEGELAQLNSGAAKKVENYRKLISNARKGDSQRTQYAAIYNQCIVSASSHFQTAAKDLFAEGISNLLESGAQSEILTKLDFHYKATELRDFAQDPGELYLRIGRVLSEKMEINFQNVLSINEGFKRAFEGEVVDRALLDEIGFVQEARHVIVHNSAKVDKRMLGRVKDKTARAFYRDISLDDQIQFSPDDVVVILAKMLVFLNQLSGISSRSASDATF